MCLKTITEQQNSGDTRAALKLTIFYCGADMPWKEIERYGFRRRNTYLLKGFIEHPDVSLVIVLTSVVRETFLQKLKELRKKQINTEDKVVDVYVASILPEHWWLPGVGLINQLLTQLQIKWQVGSLGHCKPVVWCYWPPGFNLAKKLNLPGLWVFDADHNIIDDPNQDEMSRDVMEEWLMDCAKRTRLIVAGARSMLRWFKARNVHHCAYLRNGVDLARFTGTRNPPQDIQHIPHPRIGYSGTLSRWIDYDLLINLARKRPDWNFIIIGDVYKISHLNKVGMPSSITFLGSRAPQDIPSYLAAFDVGLSLYKLQSSSWLDGDSMKIFEYLASGLPVVSTPFHPHLNEDFLGLLQTAKDTDEFEEAIEHLLMWSVQQKAEWDQRRCRFLKDNTWACRTQEAINLIQSASHTGRAV